MSDLPPIKIKESQVVTSCLHWLNAHGVRAWRNNTGGSSIKSRSKKTGKVTERFVRFGEVGSPDIIGMTNSGQFLGIECKAGKNKQSDHQKRFQEQTDKRNGLYILAYSVDDLAAFKEEIVRRP